MIIYIKFVIFHVILLYKGTKINNCHLNSASTSEMTLALMPYAFNVWMKRFLNRLDAILSISISSTCLR